MPTHNEQPDLGRLTWTVRLIFGLTIVNLLLVLFFHVNVSPENGFVHMDDPEGEIRFHELSVDQMIEKTSVIVRTTQAVEEGHAYDTIAEILKQEEGTTFYCGVGNRLRGARPLKPNESIPEGMLNFYVGSPARFVYGTSYGDGRCPGFGDMPLSLLRAKIQASE